MADQIIVSIGNTAAVLLSPEDLHSLGVQVGDAIELSASPGQLLVRPKHSLNRQQHLDAALEEIVQQRGSAYQRLAE